MAGVAAAWRAIVRAARVTAIGLSLGLCAGLGSGALADETFTYSSQGSIRGINLTLGTDTLLTVSPIATTVNALAINTAAGLVYYGDGTRVYRWDPALGAGAAAHSLMNDFATAPLSAPIRNMDSASGSFVDGRYYVGSESDQGYVDDIFELTMSIDGTQVVSVRALDLPAACSCTGVQLGGFGDTAATLEGGRVVLYGATTDISGSGAGTAAGRWRFEPDTGDFTLLSTAAGGQMSGSADGRVFTNVGNSVREFDVVTGTVGTTSLFTTTSPPFDFTEGFTFDFGDAADSYGSAFHRLGSLGSAVVRIGALGPDNEVGTLNGIGGAIDGRGDDLAGVDDEDALGVPPPLDANDAAYALTVQCSAGARVAGWIDLDVSGVFDARERNANHPLTCLAGQATLLWPTLPGVRGGDSVVRLRASTNAASVSDPTGIASDGEVEDHPLTITGSPDGPVTGGGSCAADEIRSLYTAADLPIPIGPNAGTTAVSRISVPDALVPTDVNLLDVSGTHTYINDLVFSLRHAGTTRTLYGPACDFRNDFSFGFDDEATTAPPCAPTDGLAHTPSQSLDAFDGVDASGEWQLRVRDRFDQDGGSLASWALEICSAVPAVVEAPDLRLGKSAGVNGRTVTFTLLATNVGNTDLEDFALVDELDTVFGAGNFSIVSPPTLLDGPTGFLANPTWDGTPGNADLLVGAPVLPTGASVRVAFSIRVDALSGGVAPGVYENQASASGTSPGGLLADDLSGVGLDLSSDTDAPTSFTLDAGIRLSGRVFRDTSVNAAVAHDGIRQDVPAADEPGVGGRTVSVIDGVGRTLAVVRSGAGGAWSVALEAAAADQPLRVVVQPDGATVFVGESPPFATGPVDDGEVVVTAAHGESVTGIDVGVVDRPTLALDHDRVAAPGTSVRHAHRYRASSHGTLTVSLVAAGTPSGPAWASRLVRDAGCDGRIDPGDPTLDGGSASFTVAFDEALCFVVDVFVPADAASTPT